MKEDKWNFLLDTDKVVDECPYQIDNPTNFANSTYAICNNKCYVQTYPFPKRALVFTCLQYKSFENTEGKGGIARNEQFLLFPQCFLSV